MRLFAEDFKGQQPLKSRQVRTNFRQYFYAYALEAEAFNWAAAGKKSKGKNGLKLKSVLLESGKGIKKSCRAQEPDRTEKQFQQFHF